MTFKLAGDQNSGIKLIQVSFILEYTHCTTTQKRVLARSNDTCHCILRSSSRDYIWFVVGLLGVTACMHKRWRSCLSFIAHMAHLQKRRIAELLASHIPPDEALLMRNGK